MPGIGRYPCTSCHYVAGNRRMLARHVVLIHSEKAFKCPLCPFITRYAANWYRHKRDLHGLTKITNCEICGFFANSTTELAQHKESRHPEHLHLDKYEDKYAKEKQRLSGDPKKDSDAVAVEEEVVNKLQPDNSIIDIYDIKTEEEENDSVTFSLPANGLLETSLEEPVANGHSEESPNGNLAMNDVISDSPVHNLGPLKVKRSYSCDQCGLLTGNPREYLHHLRNIHGEKINIFECKYCIYASKHVQKLHRHCNLVHRQLLEKDPDYKKHLEATKKTKPDMFSLGFPSQNLAVGNSQRNQNSITKKPLQRKTQVFFNCSACDYRTRNKAFLLHHEKTIHLKKRFYRCLQCGYVTNEKGRYTKHIKYHSLPKMQCEFCFFKTAYKWNMERHMKNHEEGAPGAFHCTECNFTTSTRQSFKSHITNHHNANGVEEEEFEDENVANDSADWEDVDVVGMDDDDEDNYIPMNENSESFDYSDTRETETLYKNEKPFQKSLKCKSCEFVATWPFELKKHEESHRHQKKHPCPLCGMRFEHLAWLSKHLRRVHQENSQAGNFAAAYDLMKPSRRRPAVNKESTAEPVLPIYQQVLKPNVTSKPPMQTNQNSMLSTLLNKPLNPPVPSPALNSSANKYLFKSKSFAASTNMSRHLRVSSYNEKPQTTDSITITVAKPSKSVPTCSVCGYKTRWLSELQRHMRVHSQEKPFHCHKCKYHCKWKGDLNRHLMKYHGIKVPSTNNKKYNVPKFKSSSEQDNTNSWQNLGPEIEITQITSTPLRRSTEESPLDLTTKDSFSSQCTSSDMYDPYDFENFSVNDSNLDPVIDVESEEASVGMDLGSYKSPLQQMSEQSVPGEAPNSKRKYQCPFCDFGTTTASRFHVHIVQHYNRRPFMCSVCNHSSNWEWDITKHIRLKGCRDKFNNKACVLLTDESGRRNYEKYEKYLVDINYTPTTARALVPKFSEPSTLPEPEATRNVSRTSYVEPTPPKSCTYDFRNIGSNFEDSRNVNANLDDTRNLSSSFEDAPENIVVTPDINIPDQSEVLGSAAEYLYGNQYSMLGTPSKATDTKMFTCKHCDFKHATKRVVVSHLSLHAGIKPFRCRACGISSNWRHVIVRHVKDSHNGYMNEVEDRINYVQDGHTLRLAGPGSNIKEAYKPNLEKIPNTQRQFFECKICPYRCDKEFYMKFHMKQHRPREGADFKCDYCPYYVKFKKTLARHIKLHNGTATAMNSFDESPEYSNSNSYETDNLSINNDRNDDVYDFYSQTNDSADDSIAISFDTLNQYSTAESSSPQKAKRHTCEGCPYKTDNKTQYLYHKQFHRPNPTAPFKCTVCSYWATMQHLLTQHMKVHEPGNESENSSPLQKQPTPAPEKTKLDDDEEGYDKMSVVYVKRGDLIVKMFKCGYCPMMNKKKANVRVHQKMHGVIVNNGKFACSYCDYQCLNQGGLTNHLKIHQKLSEKLTIIEEHGMEYETTRKRPSDTGEDDASVTKKKIFSYFCAKCPAQFKSSHDLDIHMKFHGASFAFPCEHCDYRAKHKPHLIKHMTVHSPDYIASRNSSQNAAPDTASSNDPVNVSIVKKIDQMLLLEVSELSTALKKTGHAINNLHRCVLCPAVFIKSATLVYHVSLHGSDGKFKCPHCDYAVNRAPNLTTHVLVHPKKTPVKRPPPAKKAPLKTFPCPKCPAVFYKQDRYDRHFGLHGRNWKFVCEHCDYSVRFAANLIKHKRLHLPKPDAENATPATGVENATPVLHAANPLTENVNILDLEEKKLIYLCDRCPYSQARRDAVQSHMRRHWLRDGFKCPYCDYSSMQSGFLQTHIKMHIQPNQLFPAQCFMKYESFKIWSKDENGDDVILFDDEDMVDDLPDDDDEDETSSKRSAEDDLSEPRKMRRLSYDSSTNDSNCFDSNTKVPVVVLSDIFSKKDKDSKKWVPKLKIPKLKITKSSSNEKMYTKINISDYEEVGSSNVTYKAKPSLVVKISKVEGLKNHDKAMYSISTKSSDNSYSSPNKSQSLEHNTSVNFCNSGSMQTAINNSLDIESKNTKDLSVHSNSKPADKSFKIETVKDVNTDQNGTSSELTTLQTKDNYPTNSDTSFTLDQVPSKELSKDSLSALTDLTIDSEIPLSKGSIDSPLLPNGLVVLPEEIKVDS